MRYTVHHHDALEWARKYSGPRFHAMLCDPPYHLGGSGFMGEEWDKGDLAFSPDTWSTLSGVLLPGAMALVFAGAYNSHHVAIAMERAGFVIYPQLAWVYAQGMGLGRRYEKEGAETHRYGKQALKPAHEPIICAQKPPDRDTLSAMLDLYGTGAFNVDGTRIGSEVRVNPPAGNAPGGNAYMMSRNGMPSDAEPTTAVGRYPSNVLFTSPAIHMVSELAGRDLSQFYEILPWWGIVPMRIAQESSLQVIPKPSRSERDAGLDEAEDTNVGVYMGRRGGSFEGEIPTGKNNHPTVKPRRLTEWLARLLLPPRVVGETRLFNPFSGSGSEMIGAIRAGWDTVDAVEQHLPYVNMSIGRALALAKATVTRG